MREYSDQQFDADAARKLKFSLLVTLRQQQTAKERLLRCAAQQMILPPQVIEEPMTLRGYAGLFRLQVSHVLNILIFDSSAYERAHYPRFSQFYMHGRCAFARLYA